MLSAMRRHAYSWFIRAVLFLIVVVFAFWGIGTGFFTTVHPIASVDGQTILADEVDQTATRLRRSLQQLYSANAADILKHNNLRQEALQQIIEGRLLQREALRIGLEISDDDLQRRITSSRSFQVDGQFDFATYEAVLRDNDLLPADFERIQRAAMAADMLRGMVEAGVQVSDQDARLEFDRHNARLAMAYVEIPAAEFAARIAPSENQLAEFYKKNAETFREPERIKVLFVDYDPKALADKLKPSDSEIEQYYNKNKATLFSHPDQLRARHILIGVTSGAGDREKAEAKAKAEDILRQVKAGGDFAKLAAQYSDDPGNKFNGGDLGLFGRGQMVKPFEDAVFKLKPGEATIVQTQFGYHVVRVDEVRPAHTDTLAEARPRIVDALKRKAGSDIARDALHEDFAAALDGKSLADLAAKRGLSAVETPFFALDEPVKGTESNPEFAQMAFKLDEGETRAITGHGADSFLVKLLKRRPSRIPPLSEIEPKVRRALVAEKADQAASDLAESLLKRIKSADDFAKVAAAGKLRVHDTGEFSRSAGPVPGIGRFPEVGDAAAAVAKIPGVIDRVMEYQGDSYIFEVLSRRPPTDDEWKSDGPAFTARLLETRRAATWAQFVDGLKERATITIDANQLGQASDSSM